jgi:HK97 family phage major capsid protein
MFKLLKLLKSLKAQGFASADAKAEVKALVKEAGAEAEVVADDVAEVDALPETPKADNEEVEKTVTKLFAKSVKEVKDEAISAVNSAVAGIKKDVEAFAKTALETKAGVPSLSKQIDGEAYKAWAVAVKGGRKADFAVNVKLAGDISISGNITGELPQADLDTAIVDDKKRQPFILDLVSVSPTSSPLVAWIEETDGEGDALPVAELAKLPAKDRDYARKTREVKKIGEYSKFSREMANDLPSLVADIKAKLLRDIQLKVDSQLLSGDGEYDNLVGILTNAVAYDAGDFDGTVVEPNHFDVIETAATQVVTALHMPNVVIVHPTDLSKMKLAKGSDGHYVLPPFIASNGTSVSGLRVVSNTGVTAGTFLVGDFTRARVKILEGLTLEMTNTDQDDFVKERFTVKGTVRLALYVPENDYEAFVTGTFASAISDLTKAS